MKFCTHTADFHGFYRKIIKNTMKFCTHIAGFHGFSQFKAGQAIKENQILLQLWASAKRWHTYKQKSIASEGLRWYNPRARRRVTHE